MNILFGNLIIITNHIIDLVHNLHVFASNAISLPIVEVMR